MPQDFPSDPNGWVERSQQFLTEAEKPANAGVFGVLKPALDAQKAQTTVVKGLADEEASLDSQLKGVRAQLKAETPKLASLVRANLGAASKSGASDDLKSEAGVTIPKPTVKSAPKSPTELMALPSVNGTVTLKWKRNGNIPATKFLVEKRIGAGDWMLVDVVTAISLTTPAKVGERASFQVSARNGQGTSEPSNEAVIYGD